jgi:hypothetical protein
MFPYLHYQKDLRSSNPDSLITQHPRQLKTSNPYTKYKVDSVNTQQGLIRFVSPNRSIASGVDPEKENSIKHARRPKPAHKEAKPSHLAIVPTSRPWQND